MSNDEAMTRTSGRSGAEIGEPDSILTSSKEGEERT